MNKLFKDLKYQIFHSGNPLFLYIGINALIFAVLGILRMLIALTGISQVDLQQLMYFYMGVPAALQDLPLKFYTLITYMFFHNDIFHVLFNMLWLYWFGQIFLNFLSKRQFHFIYFMSGLAGALVYILAFNIFPLFKNNIATASLIGSSAAVMGIVFACATFVPNYSIRLMFFGIVKIKYLALVYFILNILSLASSNAGGSFAHIGGAIFGIICIKMLQKGHDWSKIFSKSSKLKVVKNKAKAQENKSTGTKSPANNVSQEEIDAILDKISKTGYDKLTKEEKEKLFKASKR